VTIPFTWRAVFDVNDIPYSYSITNIQVEEIIRSQSTRAGCSSVDNDFIGLNTNSAMCGTG
jgi:hypothetical protein